MEDCIFLLADGQMKQIFEGFLKSGSMHRKLEVRPFSFDIIVDSQGNDAGVYTRGHNLLRSYIRTHTHAMVVLDQEREGAPSVEVIRTTIHDNLCRTGWREEQVEVIVIEPELDIWLWQNSPHMADTLHFDHSPHPTLRTWMEREGWWKTTDVKPTRPKETFQKLLRRAKVPDSGSIRATIVKKMSVQHCTDPAFCQLRDTLRRWFPPANPNGDYS